MQLLETNTLETNTFNLRLSIHPSIRKSSGA